MSEKDNCVTTKSYVDKALLERVYPIGSIYMSIEDKNPTELFGGEWEQLKDRFLLGAGDIYTAGETGGEAKVALTKEELPEHNHASYEQAYGAIGWDGWDKTFSSGTLKHNINDGSHTVFEATGGAALSLATSFTGGGQAHNNMPPYLAVYMWKRIS